MKFLLIAVSTLFLSGLAQGEDTMPKSALTKEFNSVHQFFRTHSCKGCHGVFQEPKFAVENAGASYNTIEEKSLVDRADFSNSRFLVRLANRHCGQDCDGRYVEEMKGLLKTWLSTQEEKQQSDKRADEKKGKVIAEISVPWLEERKSEKFSFPLFRKKIKEEKVAVSLVGQISRPRKNAILISRLHLDCVSAGISKEIQDFGPVRIDVGGPSLKIDINSVDPSEPLRLSCSDEMQTEEHEGTIILRINEQTKPGPLSIKLVSQDEKTFSNTRKALEDSFEKYFSKHTFGGPKMEVRDVQINSFAICLLFKAGQVKCLQRKKRQSDRFDFSALPIGVESTGSFESVPFIEFQPPGEPEIPVTQLILGDGLACVLLQNSQVKCWGPNSFGIEAKPYSKSGLQEIRKSPPLNFDPDKIVNQAVTRIFSAPNNICARLGTRRISCLGKNLYDIRMGGNRTEATVPIQRKGHYSLLLPEFQITEDVTNIFFSTNSYVQFGTRIFSIQNLTTPIETNANLAMIGSTILVTLDREGKLRYTQGGTQSPICLLEDKNSKSGFRVVASSECDTNKNHIPVTQMALGADLYVFLTAKGQIGCYGQGRGDCPGERGTGGGFAAQLPYAPDRISVYAGGSTTCVVVNGKYRRGLKCIGDLAKSNLDSDTGKTSGTLDQEDWIAIW